MKSRPKQPYDGLPNFQFWRRSFEIGSESQLDPVSGTRFSIDRETKVAAAGSCFAQHVARHIRARGYNFLVTERPHEIFELRAPYDDANAETLNYQMFSARYGNIYTARQLLQLLQRAYGQFSPRRRAWKRDEMFVDPFRPQVEPGGYVSREELLLDQQHHFAAVRRMIETADVFVFTLGLTEAWRDRRDGAVYPLAPGVAGGRYDPEVHEFVNFDVASVVADMEAFIAHARSVNPTLKFILTVSPVPLMATYEPRHVLQSTVYSKSVLRVAAQMLFDRYDFVDYFPSYEIITSPQCSGRYFVGDKRTVGEDGVEHVMRMFFRHYAAPESPPSAAPPAAAETRAVSRVEEMERLVRVMCDEEALDRA